jgi:hypothetical protein
MNWTVPPEEYGEDNDDLCGLRYIKYYIDKNPNEDFFILDKYMKNDGSFMELDYPYIGVNRPALVKKDTEDAIRWYLQTKKNITGVNINFKWRKTKRKIYPIGY